MRAHQRLSSGVRALLMLTMFCGAVLAPVVARAADGLWVETAPLDSRDQAVAILADAGLDTDAVTARVVGRFIKGSGWRFVVRVEGAQDLSQATSLAQALAAAGGTQVLVLEQQNGQVHTVDPLAIPQAEGALDDGAAPSKDSDRSGTKDQVVDDDLPSARGVLRAAIKAHGGSQGGIELVEQATAITMTFERKLAVDDGQLVALNEYARLGDAVRLDVEITEGVGTNSTTIITPENRAWVVVDGEPLARDVARTREVLARFAPRAILAVPLGLARDIAEAAAWQDLETTAIEPLAGRDQLRLQPRTRAAVTEGLLAAWFDAKSSRLSQVQWQSPAGLLTFGFDDYAEVAPGLVVPFHCTVGRDGRPVESIQITEFGLEPELSADLFADP
ncbi:MAG: hypothetical protein GXP62_20575 [Oligoflexia bacterium]|nr:hypothetical protein [Oligoflexia bacterium]